MPAPLVHAERSGRADAAAALLLAKLQTVVDEHGQSYWARHGGPRGYREERERSA